MGLGPIGPTLISIPFFSLHPSFFYLHPAPLTKIIVKAFIKLYTQTPSSLLRTTTFTQHHSPFSLGSASYTSPSSPFSRKSFSFQSRARSLPSLSGVTASAIDTATSPVGIGIKDQGVFPDIRADTDQEAQRLLALLGMPFRVGGGPSAATGRKKEAQVSHFDSKSKGRGRKRTVL